MHQNHSLSGEPRIGLVSRLRTQGITTTHLLESQGHTLSAPLKHSKVSQSLTHWRVNGRHCKQARNMARHNSHSPTGESRTGIISKLETQQGQQPLTDWRAKDKHCQQARNNETSQPLTCWRIKDRHCQLARNTVSHNSHSLSGEPRIGIVNKLEA